MNSLSIEMQKKKIVIVGLGYVGLVSAACFAEKGYSITCFDSDPERIKALSNDQCPFFEPHLEDLLIANKDRLKYTSNKEEAYTNANMVFIAVGTPQMPNGEADLSYVYQVLDDMAFYLNQDCLIITKSTVPVKTNERLLTYIKSKIKKHIKIDIASNPEFLSQGTAVNDMMNASRIVIGANKKTVQEIVKQFYAPFNIPLVITSLRGAELIKYSCNAFLATKISFMNDIALLCERLDVSIDDIKLGMQYDNRIGNSFLNAGIGYGGSCFSKDTSALINMGQENDVDLTIIKSTVAINKRQRKLLLEKLMKEYPDLSDIHIGVLGVTYKPNTDDIRDAPSIEIISSLLENNALVHVYDPKGLDAIKGVFKERIHYESSCEEAIQSSEIILILTEWDEFKNIAPLSLKNKIVFDGRNCLNKEQISVLQKYIGVGRNK